MHPIQLPPRAVLRVDGQGLKVWKNADNRFTVVALHYSADPVKDAGWVDGESVGYPGGCRGKIWQREYELSFDAFSGSAVYTEYDSFTHEKVLHNYQPLLYRSFDWGYRFPACVYLQVIPLSERSHPKYPKYRIEVIGEVHREAMGLREFLDCCFEYEALCFGKGREYVTTGDVAGTQTDITSAQSCFDVLREYGIYPYYRKQSIISGIASVRQHLTTDNFSIDPTKCPQLCSGFSREYRYPENNVGELPEKDAYPSSHLMDAIRYGIVHISDMFEEAQEEPIEEEFPTYNSRCGWSRGVTC